METRLTARESEVLGLVAEGYLDQEVAARLGLRPRTVSSYLTSIYAKLEVRTRTAAVRVARTSTSFNGCATPGLRLYRNITVRVATSWVQC